VNLDNGGDVELLIRFDGYPGKYVFHCHNLEHEDMMMMANFEVV
jgi:FtsP/CotA-like multicopper oxidase with cupredoxin domain